VEKVKEGVWVSSPFLRVRDSCLKGDLHTFVWLSLIFFFFFCFFSCLFCLFGGHDENVLAELIGQHPVKKVLDESIWSPQLLSDKRVELAFVTGEKLNKASQNIFGNDGEIHITKANFLHHVSVLVERDLILSWNFEEVFPQETHQVVFGGFVSAVWKEISESQFPARFEELEGFFQELATRGKVIRSVDA
jgi:hypothetical protein